MILVILLLLIYSVNGLMVLKAKDWDRSLYEEYVSEPLATVKVGKNLKTQAISFCFRFLIDGAFSKQTGFSALDFYVNFATWFLFPADYGFVLLNSNALLFNIPKDVLRPYSWFNFCFSRNLTHYMIASNGKLWFENKIRHDMVDDDIFLNELVVVGMGLKGK